MRGERPPSLEFQQAFIYSGSLVVECDFCGRTHFANREDAGDWGKGELERLRESEEQDPGMFMGWDCTSIGQGTVDGRDFAECCPCRSIWRYERWIWEHRIEIANYLAVRSQREARRARSEAEELAIAKRLMDQDWAVSRLQEVMKNVRDSACVDEPVGLGGEIVWCEPDVHGWRYSGDSSRWEHFDRRKKEGAA